MVSFGCEGRSEDHLETSIPKDKLHSSPNVVTFLLLVIYDMQEISAAVSAMATLLQKSLHFYVKCNELALEIILTLQL